MKRMICSLAIMAVMMGTCSLMGNHPNSVAMYRLKFATGQDKQNETRTAHLQQNDAPQTTDKKFDSQIDILTRFLKNPLDNIINNTHPGVENKLEEAQNKWKKAKEEKKIPENKQIDKLLKNANGCLWKITDAEDGIWAIEAEINNKIAKAERYKQEKRKYDEVKEELSRLDTGPKIDKIEEKLKEAENYINQAMRLITEAETAQKKAEKQQTTTSSSTSSSSTSSQSSTQSKSEAISQSQPVSPSPLLASTPSSSNSRATTTRTTSSSSSSSRRPFGSSSSSSSSAVAFASSSPAPTISPVQPAIIDEQALPKKSRFGRMGNWPHFEGVKSYEELKAAVEKGDKEAAAKKDDAAVKANAKAKIAEVEGIRTKLEEMNPSIFVDVNAEEINELVYEMLNWPEDTGTANFSAGLGEFRDFLDKNPEATRAKLQSFEYQDLSDVSCRVERAIYCVSQSKILTDKALKQSKDDVSKICANVDTFITNWESEEEGSEEKRQKAIDELNKLTYGFYGYIKDQHINEDVRRTLSAEIEKFIFSQFKKCCEEMKSHTKIGNSTEEFFSVAGCFLSLQDKKLLKYFSKIVAGFVLYQHMRLRKLDRIAQKPEMVDAEIQTKPAEYKDYSTQTEASQSTQQKKPQSETYHESLSKRPPWGHFAVASASRGSQYGTMGPGNDYYTNPTKGVGSNQTQMGSSPQNTRKH